MEILVEQPRSLPWRRYGLIAAGILLLGTGIFFAMRPKVNQWRAEKFAKRGREYLQKKDFTGAAFSAQCGLSIDSSSLACWELMAEVGEACRHPETIYARTKIIDLQKGALGSVMECAEAGMRIGDPKAALNALDKLGAEKRNDAGYFALRGKVARALGDWQMALDAYAKAMTLAPGNEDYQLAYTETLLDRGWIEDRPAARATLERMAANPGLRLHALRALVKDSFANDETGGALAKARELANMPEAGFSEKMILLELLRRSNNAEFASTFAAMKVAARSKAEDTVEMALWMSRHGLIQEALDWEKTFEAKDWQDPHVCATLAVNHFATGNWQDLEQFVRKGNWNDVEYFRCALLTRALREEGNAVEATKQWNAAVAAAANVAGARTALAQLVKDWGWEIQYLDLLRGLIRDPGEVNWAVREIMPILARRRATGELWEASRVYLQYNPDNDAAGNNFAMYSLLLGRGLSQAHELAAKLYEKHSQEGNYVSTYAYSLILQGKPVDALRVFSSLDEAQLEYPEVATYYAIILARNRDRKRAAKYLEFSKGATLLPEEEKLVLQTRNSVEAQRTDLD